MDFQKISDVFCFFGSKLVLVFLGGGFILNETFGKSEADNIWFFFVCLFLLDVSLFHPYANNLELTNESVSAVEA